MTKLPATVSTEAELLDILKSTDRREDHHVIGIDGMEQVGKTTLANHLAESLAATSIELDRHLDRKMNTYVPFLRCDEVSAKLAVPGAIIVEGICLLAAQRRCGFALHTHVYVKRIGRHGVWHEEDICMGNYPPQVLKERELGMMTLGSSGAPASPEDLGVHGEIIDYHADFKPVENADIIFEWHEPENQSGKPHW